MHYQNFNSKKHKSEILEIFGDLDKESKLTQKALKTILRKHPKDSGQVFSKDELIRAFLQLQKSGDIPAKKPIPKFLKKKPTRTISGVTTVTVLTKPFACPGKCIFCPNDITMPKSYIASEPGAQRALANRFNPYFQVYNRLKALYLIGHPTEKIELLVLGGTWSYYPLKYQLWFIAQCFRAMNDFDPDKLKTIKIPSSKFDTNEINQNIRESSKGTTYNDLIKSNEYQNVFSKFINNEEKETSWEELRKLHKINENAHSRCVGLVLETRPDTLNPKEVLKLRKFGATKVQIGVQTLDPEINGANKRMESIEQIKNAFSLLRQAGFKIHAHIMPNMYKATPQKDLATYKKLFESKYFKPDELKIYPTSIIKNTPLFELYKSGKYKPYSRDILIDLLAKFFEMTPKYTRLSRVIRDIPSEEIEAGNKTTNLRQLVQNKMQLERKIDNNIRSREIRFHNFDSSKISFDKIIYDTDTSVEYFLEYITKDQKLLGFLRLSIHKTKLNPITSELDNSTIIREIHVYGPAQNIGQSSTSQAQHIGIGTRLIEKAKEISKDKGFKKMSVISAIGTRSYYRKKGFFDGNLYQWLEL